MTTRAGKACERGEGVKRKMPSQCQPRFFYFWKHHMSLKNLVAGVEDTDCLQSFPMSIHIINPAPLVSKAF